MISIIVCHRDKERLEKLEENISTTIGTSYELIIIDNSNNQYNIFQAYNLGVQKAKGDILAFCHEDILFHTKGWGKLLNLHFSNNKKLGLIGVVGGTALPKAPAPWWNHHPINTHYINNIQHWSNNQVLKTWKYNRKIRAGVYLHQNNPTQKPINRVLAVDGFFMACPKTIFNSITFDTLNFKGFHCYDVDICLQVNQAGYEVSVVHDILIEHTSQGSTNQQWAESAIICARKWKDTLPLTIEPFSHKQLQSYNIASLLNFCYWSKQQLPDKQLQWVINEFLPTHKKWPVSRNHLLLILWKQLGYKTARIPYKLLKLFFND